MALHNINNMEYYICIYSICYKYNIIHAYSSKYIKRMQFINYINLSNYRNMTIQLDVVIFLHLPGILAEDICV
jgi:hypothetical protein